jgi:hypothetical protein
MPNHRSPDAPLSPAELTALTRVAFGEASSLPQDHRDAFMRMGLAVLDGLGNLVLTDAGRSAMSARWQGDVLARRERAAETLAIRICRELNRFDAGRVLYLAHAIETALASIPRRHTYGT